MKIKLVMDSAGDRHEFEGIDFQSVPMKIIAGEREFVDDKNLDLKGMVEYLKTYNGKSSTACPGVGEYIESFGDYDIVYVVTITSNLSGSYNSAKVASEQYMEMYPDRKVHVFDSLSTGPEMVILGEKIVECVNKGMEHEQLIKTVLDYHESIRTVYSLESLRNLVNNGRVPAAVATIADVLSIRLIGIASDEGTLKPTGKARGEKKVPVEIFKYMTSHGYTGGKVHISHCFNEDGAIKLKETILSSYPDAEIYIARANGLDCFYAEMGGIICAYEHI